MTWFRVDDKLHDHRKIRKAGKAAMGVWVLAGSWAMGTGSDGFVPEDVLLRWGVKADANRLVAAGLWLVDELEGEQGWRFHDWEEFQPSAEVQAAWRAAESEAGQRGNHKRWHKDRGITDPACSYCYRVPDQDPDEVPDRVDVGSGIGSTIGSSSPVTQTRSQEVSPNGETTPPEPPRPDVERICAYLADAIAENGSKRPNITKTWRDEGRRLLDLDGRTEAEVLRAIDWCQRGESAKAMFWRPNVMSMPKLRAKFDQMRLQAAAESKPVVSNVQRHLQLARELAEQERGPQPPQPFQIGGAS